MDKQSAYRLIYIGLNIRLLQKTYHNTSIKIINDSLKGLEIEMKNANFTVSSQHFKRILEEIKVIIDDHKLTETSNATLQAKLSATLQELETTVAAEGKTKSYYVLPERRYNGLYLLERPQNLFKPDVFEKLSDIAKFDIASCCRCLLFGEGTAAAFHILRATEDTLKQYYYVFKKTNRLRKPMWFNMTNELQAKKSNKPNLTVLNSLDLIRVSYRNPTQHPEAKYDIESSQDLFGVCIDVINKMGESI